MGPSVACTFIFGFSKTVLPRAPCGWVGPLPVVAWFDTGFLFFLACFDLRRTISCTYLWSCFVFCSVAEEGRVSYVEPRGAFTHSQWQSRQTKQSVATPETGARICGSHSSKSKSVTAMGWVILFGRVRREPRISNVGSRRPPLGDGGRGLGWRSGVREVVDRNRHDIVGVARWSSVHAGYGRGGGCCVCEVRGGGSCSLFCATVLL